MENHDNGREVSVLRKRGPLGSTQAVLLGSMLASVTTAYLVDFNTRLTFRVLCIRQHDGQAENLLSFSCVWRKMGPVVALFVIATVVTRSNHALAESVYRYIGPCESGCASGSPDADVVLGALMDFHDWNYTTSTCSDQIGSVGSVWQWSEAMRFAVEQANAVPDLLPGLTLGFDMRDTCSNAQRSLKLTVEFLSAGSQSDDCGALNNSTSANSTRAHMPVPAIIGPFGASQTEAIAQLTALFQMPLISYTASNPELGSRCNYPFFSRSVPSDAEEILLAVELASRLGWTYLSFIYSDDAFGREAFNLFMAFSRKRGVCLAAEIKIKANEVSSAYYDAAVAKLLRNTTDEPYANARIALVYIGAVEGEHFFRAVMKDKVRFVDRNWLVGGAFANIVYQHADILLFLAGSFSVAATQAFQEVLFENRLLNVTNKTTELQKVSTNPWLIKHIESNRQTGTGIPGAALTNPYSSYMRDAVFAAAHAMNTTISQQCTARFGTACSRTQMKDIVEEHRQQGRRLNGLSLQENLEKVRFTSPVTNSEFMLDRLTGERVNIVYNYYTSYIVSVPTFKFNVVSAGDALVRYSLPILQVNQSANGTAVGEAQQNDSCRVNNVALFDSLAKPDIIINRTNIDLAMGVKLATVGKKSIESICAKPCPTGTEPVRLKSGHAPRCCWTCRPCRVNFRSRGNNSLCTECLPTEESTVKRDGCTTLPLQRFEASVDGESITLVILATVVLIVNIVLVTVAVYAVMKHSKAVFKPAIPAQLGGPATPPLRWPLGGVSLTFTSLAGCLLFAVVAFLTVGEPSSVHCSSIVFFFFLAFVMLSVTVLAHAMQRHFARRDELGLRRPSYIESTLVDASEDVPGQRGSSSDPSGPIDYSVDKSGQNSDDNRNASQLQLQAVTFVVRPNNLQHRTSLEDAFTANAFTEPAANRPKVHFKARARFKRKSRRASSALARRLRALPLSRDRDRFFAICLVICVTIIFSAMSLSQSPSKRVERVTSHSRHVEYCETKRLAMVTVSIIPLLTYIFAVAVSVNVVLMVKKQKKRLQSDDTSPLVFLLLWLLMYVVLQIVHLASPSDYQSKEFWAVTGRQCFAMLLVVLAMNLTIHLPGLSSLLKKKPGEEDREPRLPVSGHARKKKRPSQKSLCSHLSFVSYLAQIICMYAKLLSSCMYFP